MADIVIYGGTFAGVAAAAKAAANIGSGKTVGLIVPDVSKMADGIEPMLGGIGTAGGQNYFDVKGYPPKSGQYATRGTFNWWRSQQGLFYNTEAMAALLKAGIENYPTKIYPLYAQDIESFTVASSPYRLTSVTVRGIERDPLSGYVRWKDVSTRRTVAGSVFIDASDDGRLARLVNFAGTSGRHDWPAELLDDDEKGPAGKARQQAATLMFMVKGVETKTPDGNKWKYMDFTEDPAGQFNGAYGGYQAYRNNSVILNFNNKYRPQGYALKPLNAARNGPDTDQWWINAFLVFNVDVRPNERARETTLFPADMRADYKTVDRAWVEARNFLKNNAAEFLQALRQFDGFNNVQFVMENNYPLTGQVMYIRETVHMAKNSAIRGNDTENSNYELTTDACRNAGSSITPGADQEMHPARIGLNYYYLDINAYKHQDLLDNCGNYIWSHEVTEKLRQDAVGIGSSKPDHPVYVPYKALTTNYVANLLLPGYAAGVSALGWSEIRVIPNLCVLGDAAGIAAAYAINNSKHPLNFNQTDINAVRTLLVNNAAALVDKP
ncbi:MAG: FAD-dependent oxidoreductase [Clostridiales bacterium]|nr:FAD-dependent oxidoreductase [Clostridiales bacterium]